MTDGVQTTKVAKFRGSWDAALVAEVVEAAENHFSLVIEITSEEYAKLSVSLDSLRALFGPKVGRDQVLLLPSHKFTNIETGGIYYAPCVRISRIL